MEVGWAMVVLAPGMAQGCFCNRCHPGMASHHHCHNMHQDLCNCHMLMHHPTCSNSILHSMMVSVQEVSQVALELASAVARELEALEQGWAQVPKDALRVPELPERTQEHHQLD